MSVHYKFKSNLDCDTVTFDGLHISVADLKKSIMQQKKIGKSSDFDLQITNAQTKEVYDNEETLVPKNTSVIVARVPVVTSNKKTWDKPELPLPLDDDDDMGHIRFDKLVKSADIANTNASEDDKVKTMILQSSQEYDPSKYVKSRSMTGPLPAAYTCHRCGKQGHWIKNCPTNNIDIKRSTGIPRSFMVPVDGPEHKGALLTSSGDYAVPIIDHQAYKEVKKEKPPFVKEPDAAPEPEAEIPEHLLCMFCKNMLNDAVLIPCCGNSFCDECIRQALLDSDNHECPECHEINVFPNTLIPNRYLRSAVSKFKNEKSLTHVPKVYQPMPVISIPPSSHIDSPQPSPDSTVQNHPVSEDLKALNIKEEIKEEEMPNVPSPVMKVEVSEEPEIEKEEEPPCKEAEEKEIVEGENTEELISETPPGTPLADEPIEDPTETSLIKTTDQEPEHYYHPTSYQHRHHRYQEEDEEDDDSEPRQISTIETIATFRNKRNPMRLGQPMSQHPHFSQGMHHRADRQPDYEQRGRDYHGGYDRRNNHDRASIRGQRHHYDSSQNDRYHRAENRRDYRNYPQESRHGRQHYENHAPIEPRRHSRPQVPPPPAAVVVPPPAVVVPPPTVVVPPSAVVEVGHPPLHHPPPPQQYKVPMLATGPSQPPTSLPTPPQSFPPQPPPPGASPTDHTSHIPPQPPPPGVGPLIPSTHLQDTPSSFSSQSFQTDEIQLQPKKEEEKSLEDRLEEFQRKLDKKASESVRDRSSRSSSRSRKRSRSSSSSSSRSSVSRSYSSSSKSWSRSSSRSATRSSRSRSRTPYSSRSRTRSFTRTRSRSRSKIRSYSRSRSRSRSRTPEPRLRRSRSRDRERVREREREREKDREREREKERERERDREWDREKRRISPRERIRIPFPRNHSQSHSPSPRKFYPRNRPSQYPARRPNSYNAPHHPPPPPQSMSYGDNAYSSSYGPSTSTLPVPVLRTAPYNTSHLHASLQQPPVHSHPMEHYPIERTRYSYDEGPYTGYDTYPHTSKAYSHQRYEREPRVQHYKPQEYMREYPRREEEIEQHIPGWIGDRDRNREYKQRYGPIRDQRKDTIRGLPRMSEPELKSEIRIKDQGNSIIRHVKVKENPPLKQKSEKTVTKSTKHKKHHHRHSKESKSSEKMESKQNISADSHTDVSSSAGDLPSSSKIDIESKNHPDEVIVKPSTKVKEKKHKHKKHKTEDQLTKKKKVSKKEKIETNKNVEVMPKVKAKKKKNKIKNLDETKKKDKSKHSKKKVKKTEVETKDENQNDQQQEDLNVLTEVSPRDTKLESDHFAPEEVADDVIKLNVSNEDLELTAPVEYVAETKYCPSLKTDHSYEEIQQDDFEKSKSPELPADKNYAQQELGNDEEVDYEEDEREDAFVEEENDEKERELHVDVPELSKWEREDLEEEQSHPQRRSTIAIPKEDKGSLSSEIIQRAENVIMQKPLKKALTSSSAGKEKVKSEKKTSVKSETPVESANTKIADHSPHIQVTISTDKQRSVLAKDEVQKQPSQGRKIKLDRSNFKSFEAPSSSHRTVVEEPIIVKREKTVTKSEERNVVVKRKHTKIHGPDYAGSSDQDSSPHIKRKHMKSSKSERYVYRNSKSKEDTRRRPDSSIERRFQETTEVYKSYSDVRKSGFGHDRSQHHSEGHKHRVPAKDSHKHKSRSQSFDSPVRKKEKKKKKSKKKKDRKS